MPERAELGSRQPLGAALSKNFGSAVAGRLFGALLGVVTFAVLARAIGAEGLGTYRTVLTLLLFAGIAFDFGLHSVTLRELARPEIEQRRLLGNAATLRLVGTVCGVGLLAAGVFAANLSPSVRTGVLIAGVGWVGQQLNEFLRAVYQLRFMQHQGVIAEACGALVTLALIVGLAALNADVLWMLAATSLGFLCTAAITLIYVDRLIPLRLRIEWPVWRDLIVMGLPIAASVILVNVQLRIDVLLLSLVRSPREVGLYDLPFKLYELVYVLPALFGGLLMPLLVRDREQGGALIAPRLAAALSAQFIVAAMVCAALYVCAEPVAVLIAGPEFVESAAPLRVLAVASVFVGATAILRVGAIALLQQKRFLLADTAGACIAVLAHAWLIPRYGLMGAAFGKLCGDVATCAAAFLVLRQRLQAAVLVSALIGLMAAIGIMAGTRLVSRTGLPLILACGVSAITVFAIVFWLPRVRRLLAPLSLGHFSWKGGR